MEARVIFLTQRSEKRTTRKALARITQAMLKARATLRRTGLGRISVVTSFSVRIYQSPVRLGIDSMIEKEIIMPENMGSKR